MPRELTIVLMLMPVTLGQSRYLQCSNPKCSSTFSEHCEKTRALIKCHSCARFNGGCSNYCTRCFEAQHPRYRVKHKWSASKNDEDHSKEKATQEQRANIVTTIANAQGVLRQLSSWRRDLNMQDVDPKVIEILPDHFAKNTHEIYTTE